MLITWSYLDLFLVNKQQVKVAAAAADTELAVSDPGFGSEY